MKRVLVACEESQVVTIELRKLGIEAFSCDVQECSGGHPEWHIQDDVLKHLTGWDMIIAHPPCTDLSVCGARFFLEKQRDGRQQKAAAFFMEFVNAPCPKIAIENPIGVMSRRYRPPDQIIQPYYFGDTFQKATCLWLKGLPILRPTNIVDKGKMYEYVNKHGRQRKIPYWFALPDCPRKDRAKVRSKTFPGIAKAMAEQWGSYDKKHDEYLQQSLFQAPADGSQVAAD